MLSLRARLVAGLLVLSAIGLLLLGGITYAEQRSFLEDRLDQQVQAAIPAVSRALDDAGVAGGSASDDAGTAGGADDHGPPLGAGGPGGRGAGGPGSVNLPPGTYGQRRSTSGAVLGHVTLSYDQTTLAAPKLPADLPRDKLISVGSVGNSGLRYRVLATPSFGGGITVVAVPRTEIDSTLDRLLLVEGLVIAGVLVTLGIVAWLLVGVGLRPLEKIAATADAIAAGDLSRRVSPAERRTEVGRLGLALNAMLARLEGAFARQEASEQRLRQFLADASHELRTPLTSIRGYAELFRIGAAREPAETERAMERIEAEAARMGVLVEDLLTLARLDEVRPVVREEIDLAAVAGDSVDDARATAPDREISLEVSGPTRLACDPHQIQQVIANLVRNALVHTPAGTPIEVAVAREGADLRLDVRDHGPGLPDGEAETLFERFWRAEGGRERGRGGAGLGLAIVAGVVEAHGGRVAAANARGGGARFTVWLPALPVGEPAPTPAVPS